MTWYFKERYLNYKFKILIFFFLVLQVILTISFLNINESKIELELFNSNYYAFFTDKIILFSNISILLFSSIFLFNHDSKENIFLIIKKGRAKYFIVKFLFFTFVIFICYLSMLCITILFSVTINPYFNLSKPFIISYFKSFVNPLIFIFIILTFIKAENKSFSFFIAISMILILIVYKSFPNEISFYQYLIPLSYSNLYLEYTGYIYFVFYFSAAFLIYFLKTNYEEIKNI